MNVVYWSEYLAIGRLVFFVLMLVLFILWSKKIQATMHRSVFFILFTSLVCLLVIQGRQVFNPQELDQAHALLQSGLFTVVMLVILLSFVDVIWLSWRYSQFEQDSHNRQEWLRQVYEKIPAAVFVLKGGDIEYCNTAFVKLQGRFDEVNPFEDCHLAQQEVWLKNKKGERFCYWVATFPMPSDDGCAYIITDISAITLQRNFIEKVSNDLYHHGEKTLKDILNNIYELLPGSLIYVARKDANQDKYVYLHHMGGAEESNVSDDLFLSHTLQMNKNRWMWLSPDILGRFSPDCFITQYSAVQIGGISLCDDAGKELGIILVLQQQALQISALLKNFLSVFSLHVRFELEYLQNKKQIQKSHDRYKTFVERSHYAIVDVDIVPGIDMGGEFEKQWSQLATNGLVKEFNPAFEQLFNVQSPFDINNLLAIKSLKYVLKYIFQSAYGSEAIEVAHEDQRSQLHWISCSVITDTEYGEMQGLRLIVRDITESKMHIEKLEFQARHDLLTSLPNRLALRDAMDEKIEQALQYGFKIALLLIDLDRFKEVNDTLGHHYGDVLLKKIAPRITPLLSSSRSFFARLGGDEFAVVIPSFQSDVETHALAKKILDKLCEPFDLGQLHVEIGASVGISQYPKDGMETSELLRCADVAMYQAKKHNHSILDYDQNMDENSPRRLALMAAMGRGIKEEQFFLQYQPKLTLEGNDIYSAEALIRWQHPDMGLVNPGEFIPMAELSNVILPMTEWVIESALQQIQVWLKQQVYVKVSVNVSTRNLLDENLWGFIGEKLHQYEVPAYLFELEITESALMADPDRALDTLNKISDLGVSISVDDFGTGFSSLVYLRQLPIDALKIDIMFVKNMCVNEQDEMIVKSIIALAKNLSLTVVAEGAEDKKTLEKLKEMRCDQVQGFYIARPMAADDFFTFCKNWV